MKVHWAERQDKEAKETFPRRVRTVVKCLISANLPCHKELAPTATKFIRWPVDASNSQSPTALFLFILPLLNRSFGLSMRSRCASQWQHEVYWQVSPRCARQVNQQCSLSMAHRQISRNCRHSRRITKCVWRKSRIGTTFVPKGAFW